MVKSEKKANQKFFFFILIPCGKSETEARFICGKVVGVFEARFPSVTRDQTVFLLGSEEVVTQKKSSSSVMRCGK